MSKRGHAIRLDSPADAACTKGLGDASLSAAADSLAAGVLDGCMKMMRDIKLRMQPLKMRWDR